MAGIDLVASREGVVALRGDDARAAPLLGKGLGYGLGVRVGVGGLGSWIFWLWVWGLGYSVSGSFRGGGTHLC